MTPLQQARYLRLLGVGYATPSLHALTALVRAQMLRVPFENVSKILYRERLGLRGIPDIALYLDGIERHHFGGTCYSNASHFAGLLESLGYAVRLCGADMSKPDVHLVSMVTLEHREYLIDVGYAAPFLIPLPRDLQTDVTIPMGRDRYILRRQDAHGRSRMDVYRDGDLVHGYLAKPERRSIGDFEKPIVDSFSSDATFMNELLLARFFDDRSVVLRNGTLTTSRGAASTEIALTHAVDIAEAMNECFEIPRELAVEVLEILGR